jgi:hypothetical protein
VSVEDQLVLAADGVAEGDEARVVSRSRHQHLLALDLLADVERRRADVHEQLGACEREIGRRGPGCHMSSQIVRPTSVSPISSSTRSRPGAK